jgi:hypothetical protein
MTDAAKTKSRRARTDPKFTADQIETDCPARLQEIGRAAAERLVEADKQSVVARKQVVKTRKHVEKSEKLVEESDKQFDEMGYQVALANDHLNAAIKLIAEAKELCDDDGFCAFRQMFFQNWDRSVFGKLVSVLNEWRFEKTKVGGALRAARWRSLPARRESRPKGKGR